MVSSSCQTKNSMDTPEPLKKFPHLLLYKGILMLSLPGYFKPPIPTPVNGLQLWKKTCRQLSFYAKVTFLKNVVQIEIMQIEDKIPM
jgi:hypothetical protein